MPLPSKKPEIGKWQTKESWSYHFMIKYGILEVGFHKYLI